MKITKRHLRRLVKEAQFGRFTGGAAPLDVPMRDSGPVPKDQLRKLADIYMDDMGMSPEEVLEKPEFVEQGITDLRQLEENRVKITERRLRKLIQSILLAENPCWDGYRPGAKSGKKTKVGKSGKRVANCEKISETEDLEEEDEQVSEALYYHLDRRVGVDRNIFRPGSRNFFALFREVRSLYRQGLYTLNESEEELIRDTDIGEYAVYEGELVPLDYPMLEESESLDEAEYKGRKVELNKPKRGEGGKAYVYVNSGKKNKDGTIRVKKVSFGSSMPDAMGDSEAAKKRRKSFGDRHNCADKKDKTAPGYWSCRLTKFFGRDISGWW